MTRAFPKSTRFSITVFKLNVTDWSINDLEEYYFSMTSTNWKKLVIFQSIKIIILTNSSYQINQSILNAYIAEN